MYKQLCSELVHDICSKTLFDVSGINGADGRNGNTGATGRAGSIGRTGATGSRGNNGNTGATGDDTFQPEVFDVLEINSVDSAVFD